MMAKQVSTMRWNSHWLFPSADFGTNFQHSYCATL